MEDGGKVVPIAHKPVEDVVLMCGNCHCLSHYISADYRVQCAGCGQYISDKDGEWVLNLPPVPDEVQQAPDDMVEHAVVGNRHLARKRVMRRLEKMDKADELKAIFGYAENGEGAFWMGMVTEDDREWMLRKLNTLTEHVKLMEL